VHFITIQNKSNYNKKKLNELENIVFVIYYISLKIGRGPLLRPRRAIYVLAGYGLGITGIDDQYNNGKGIAEVYQHVK